MVKRVIKKFRGKKAEEADKLRASRITNETVVQHREQILAGGRKFKYPLQYEKHRLLINSTFVFIGALLFAVVLLWWQLYINQNTSNFFYRMTQLLPLSVASVDSQPVSYSDYLMEYRSSIHWLKEKSHGFGNNSKDSQRRSEHFKRKSLNRAIENAYAQKLADKNGIVVSDKDVDDFITTIIKNSSNRKLSRQSYEAVLSDSYGVSTGEYRSIIRYAITKQRSAFAIDKKAKQKIESVQTALASGATFDQVALKYSDDPLVQSTKGDVGFVPKNNQDQGLARAASKLNVGQVSGIIKTADSYYIVKLIDTKGDQVRYAQIKVVLREFDNLLAKLKKDDKVKEYIRVRKNS